VAVMTRSRIERPILFILVTCNAMRWLPDVVESLEASGCGDVWAVDHGSTDGTWEWLVHHLDTDARVRAPNLGFGRGNNRGLRVAQTRGYRYVYLVNQDARVEPEGVRMMFEWMEARQDDALVLSPVQKNWGGTKPYPHFEQYYAPDWRDHDQPFRVKFINAAAWMMSMRTLRAVGGFNPVFFMYGEDEEWGARLGAVGGSFWVHPDALVFHEEPTPPPLATVLERMAFGDEVTRFFAGRQPASSWKRSFWFRAGARAFQPKRWIHALTGRTLRAERAVKKRMFPALRDWEVLRAQTQQEAVRYLDRDNDACVLRP
jgi:N-acetylglucosaminyl-diphospho-decaprenol L-rhamnosyltransferase